MTEHEFDKTTTMIICKMFGVAFGPELTIIQLSFIPTLNDRHLRLSSVFLNRFMSEDIMFLIIMLSVIWRRVKQESCGEQICQNLSWPM